MIMMIIIVIITIKIATAIVVVAAITTTSYSYYLHCHQQTIETSLLNLAVLLVAGNINPMSFHLKITNSIDEKNQVHS